MAAAHTSVLAVDVGNTTTAFGLFAADERLAGSAELTTPAHLTADEARLMVADALALMGVSGAEGAILSCVVPALVQPWQEALARAVPGRTLVVGPGLRTGMRLAFDDPSEVGADRIADAVAARATYGAPVVVVDLGTTTNFEAVDARGAFVGGIIAPGLALGARSLSDAAARLPKIELHAPTHVIGTNTRAAMQSGVVLGEAARIDGLLDAMLAELVASGGAGEAQDVPVVLTGTDAAQLAALLRHPTTVDETLTLRGLALLWSTNSR